MTNRWSIDLNFIEQGDIYFFYKPKKDVDEVKGINDVGRFYFVLSPSGDKPSRYIVMGSKGMPQFEDGGKSSWGFIQIVGGRGFKTLSDRKVSIKNTSRPAGEGIYTIVSHRNHSHLLYLLELPERLGDVQRAFNIRKEADYLFLERPSEVSPTHPDIVFSNFSQILDVINLDRKGTEVLIVGVGSDIGRLGIKGQKDVETLKSADIFSKLNLDPNRHPSQSLISGKWK